MTTIKYDLAFEEVWAFVHPIGGHSQIFSLGRGEKTNLGLGFTNGVWNGPEDARRTAEYISDLAGGYNVRYVHNAGHGYVVDLLECFMGLKFIATEPVKKLHGMWDNFFDNSSSDAIFLMVGSSQGVLNIRNALLDYPEDRGRRISVIAIAPAAYVYEETCANVIHYRAESKWRDFIPRIDRAGAKRAYRSIVDLPSHPDAPYFDHYIDSPTYRGVVGDDIRSYLKQSR